MNTSYAQIAKTYKRKIAGGFMLVDGAHLMEKITGTDFVATRKMDGEMQVLFYNDGAVEAYGSHGNETSVEAPCFAEFAKMCQAAGLKSATVVAELYANMGDGVRERVCDVKTALATSTEKLQLAPFDIIDLDGQPFETEHYKDTHAQLLKLFNDTLVKCVEAKSASSKQELEQIFEEWVVANGAEGIVVHSELPIIYKVKRRHTIDAAIIGYTIGDGMHENMVRDIMLAAMDCDGNLMCIATTGTGFSEAQRTEMLATLSQMHVASEYVDTDSRNVAYQMVRPEIVVEVSVIDFVAENSKGEPKMAALLSYDANGGYSVVAQTPGVATHSPVFERIRDDKACNATDIRLSQVTDLCPFSEGKVLSLNNLPKSELIARRIFTKGEGAKLMIQKYTVWKTNKEASDRFPAYVFHYTDFSLGRKEQLKRDIRVSNSREQIMSLCEEFIAENVKKGWSEKLD